MSSYAFLRRPIWIVGVVIAVGTVVLFVALGFWQLNRLEERRALNAITEARQEVPPVSLAALLAVDGDEVEYRRAELTGTYLVDEEIILQARSFRGLSGHHVLTPLLTDSGSIVIVDRGWVDVDVVGPPVVGAEPPAGPVAVSGYVLGTETRGALGPVDPPTGELDRISRVDIERLRPQLSEPLAPFYVRLEAQSPGQQTPIPVPLEPLDEGPHLGYAVQWWLFASVIAIGFPVLLYRTARRGEPPSEPVEHTPSDAEKAEV